MKGKTIAASLLALVVLAGVAACSVAWQSAIDPIDPPAAAAIDPAAVTRGLRLVAMGDCMSCHTATGGKPFAGGVPLATPFGTLYSTNISPDADTGIGRWSLEAFTRAMRKGISRDGHLLYPAFPYAHFTHMTDEDIKDLYAYMMSRDPVHAPATPNALSFPFSFRPLLAGWNLLFLHADALPADTSHGAEWLRGRYLVEGPGHCAACHTPMNAFGAEDSGKPFAGNVIDGWNVPALNALSHAPTPWTADQLTSYLRTGLASEHGAAAGPMRPVAHQLDGVAESDIRAIAVYLLSLDANAAAPATVPAPAPAPAPVSDAAAQRLRAGEVLFTATCASCHAAAAPMMKIGGRPSLALSSVATSDDPRNAINMVMQGIPLSDGSATHYMPSFGNTLNDTQIADVLAYMRVSIAQRPAWPTLDETVAKIRKESKSK